jgi:hypothetical protein
VTSVPITQATVDGWLHALDDFDAVLDGKRLLPHWRFSQGFNFRRVFFEPRDFDLVLWAAGYSVVPYLEDGPTLSLSDWNQWNRALNGNFLGWGSRVQMSLRTQCGPLPWRLFRRKRCPARTFLLGLFVSSVVSFSNGWFGSAGPASIA